MRLWEKITDKCKRNFKFRWANYSAGWTLKFFSVKSYGKHFKFTIQEVFYIQGSSYLNADSYRNSYFARVSLPVKMASKIVIRSMTSFAIHKLAKKAVYTRKSHLCQSTLVN